MLLQRFSLPLIGALLLIAPAGAQQVPAKPAPATRSVPISNIRYEITFDSTTARNRLIGVVMSFDVGGNDPVLLSLPAWTPGAYEISNFARWVVNFSAAGSGRAIRWDKLDYDTWRLQPAGARAATVRFDYIADTLDNAMAWARPDFPLFNGTNLLPYPEGAGFDFPATVTIKTEPTWTVATAMRPGSALRSFRENSIWSTCRFSSAGWITTACGSPGGGPGSRHTRPVHSRTPPGSRSGARSPR